MYRQNLPPTGSPNLESRDHANNIAEENNGLTIEQNELDRRMTGIIFKTFTKESRKVYKCAYNNYIRECICPDLKNNPKRFFSFIKSRKCENIGESPLRDNKGKVHTDDKEKANILNTQFTSAFSNDDTITPSMSSTRSMSMPEIIISINGVKKLLGKINPHKASGPDMVSARFLREVATQISPALTLLFNASILQSIIPTDWKDALINPIYKKG